MPESKSKANRVETKSYENKSVKPKPNDQRLRGQLSNHPPDPLSKTAAPAGTGNGGKVQVSAVSNYHQNLKKQSLTTRDLIGANSPLDRLLEFTFFQDKYGFRKWERTHSLRQFGAKVNRTTAQDKSNLPWFKVALFGNLRSSKNSLRHDANLEDFDAIEIDYDKEALSIESAAALLKEAGIAGLLFETASSTPERPRWRIVCPCSKPMRPDKREALVARINGVLGGVIDNASFNSSQSYYFGGVNGKPSPAVLFVDGDYIDNAHHLNLKALGRSKTGKDGSRELDDSGSGVAFKQAQEFLRNDQPFTDFVEWAMDNPWGDYERDPDRALERTWENAKKVVAAEEQELLDCFPDLGPDSDERPKINVGNIGTDTQNAESFSEYHAGNLLYNYPGPIAHLWDGNSYVECVKAEDSELAIRFSKLVLAKSALLPESDKRTAILKSAVQLQSRKRQIEMLQLAKALPKLKSHESEFNLNTMLLGVANGVVDLKTGKLIQGDRSQRISKRAGVGFFPKAQCPLWIEFLETVLPDKSVRQFLQRAVGYTLTGIVAEDVLFFLYGGGANGKTVFMDILARLLGTYRHTLNKSTLLQRKYEGDESMRDIVKLQGMRLALASELSFGEKWNDGAVKALVQTSEITGRDLYKSKTIFKPSHKLWICSNSEPRADDDSDGLWRRFCKVPFTITIPPEKRDAKLTDKLAAELSGILNWAIAGSLAWQQDGRLIQPETVRMATATYRKSNDSIALWLDGRFEESSQSRLSVKEAYESYKTFCEEENLRYLERNAFGPKMKAHDFTSVHGKHGKYYPGIREVIKSGRFDD